MCSVLVGIPVGVFLIRLARIFTRRYHFIECQS
jgi:hypothetical protein